VALGWAVAPARARAVPRSGRARGERTLDAGATTIETAVAVDDSGGGVLAAILVGGTSGDRHDRVVAWPLRPGGGIGARRALCSPGAHATGPLGVTADGRVTWRQAQGSYAARVASGAP
jgi:hypothetical protein